MKHGDKGKSKAASKASGKKSSKAVATSKASGAKSSPVKATAKQQVQAKAAKQTTSSKPAPSGGNGKPGRTASSDGFANPTVGAAFKRAVKKYPNTFRRLTD